MPRKRHALFSGFDDVLIVKEKRRVTEGCATNFSHQFAEHKLAQSRRAIVLLGDVVAFVDRMANVYVIMIHGPADPSKKTSACIASIREMVIAVKPLRLAAESSTALSIVHSEKYFDTSAI